MHGIISSFASIKEAIKEKTDGYFVFINNGLLKDFTSGCRVLSLRIHTIDYLCKQKQKGRGYFRKIGNP